MTICENDHEEIVFKGRGCPLCMAMEDIKDKEVEIEKLNNKENE